MTLFDFEDHGANWILGERLAQKVHAKYRPAFERFSPEEQAKLALYFLPHTSKKALLEVTRPRVIKWYCPFADQLVFPSGHRYAVNVYTGCDHCCEYCYASGYVADPHAKCKNHFRRDLEKDLHDIEKYDLPCAPVHLSNSTDAFQDIENAFGHTLYTLQQLLQHRHRFSTITLLTKNPATLAKPEYLRIVEQLCYLKQDHPRYHFFHETGLPPLLLECSLAFFREESAKLLDAHAPSVKDRLQAICELRKAGIPVALRIDPLFPRSPLPGGTKMQDFGLQELQSWDDLRSLVDFAAQQAVERMIYSVLKITKPRTGDLSPTMQKLKNIYEYLCRPIKPPFRGGSWRLPESIVQQYVTSPLLQLCHEYEMNAVTCKNNLLDTP